MFFKLERFSYFKTMVADYQQGKKIAEYENVENTLLIPEEIRID